MPLLISNAILHSIGSREETTLFSNAELDMDSETCFEFVSKHVRRLLHNPGAKEATFSQGSAVYDKIKQYQKGELRFKEMSIQLCRSLAKIIWENEDIPSADFLITAFSNQNKDYLAMIKVNYGECFTHHITETENGAEAQIIKNTMVLPVTASKVDEACLIPYDPMVLHILEKPHMVGNEETLYFSKMFLECETEISKKEAAEKIIEIAEEVNTKHFSRNLEMEARLKCALIEETMDDGEEDTLVLDNVAQRVFEENEAARSEFIGMAQQSGLPPILKLDKPFVQREFKIQRFKADNGIELKCPSELFQNPDAISITNHSDGTVTIILKNLRRVEPI